MRISKRARLIVVLLVAVFGLTLIGTPRLLPTLLSSYRPDIWFSVSSKGKRIFVTIDDAPSRNTPEILAVLKKHNVPATFFVIASRVSDPGQLQAIVREEHSLGNHLATTRACSKLSPEEFRRSLDACTDILERYGTPRFFRPASDFGTSLQMSYAKTKGYQPVMGTVFPLDHWLSKPLLLKCIVRWLAVPGGILVMHDGDARGRTTATVLDELIPQLKAAGYSFGRLEEGFSTAPVSH